MRYGLNQAGSPADKFEETCEILVSTDYYGVKPRIELDGPLTTEMRHQKTANAVAAHDLRVPAVSTISIDIACVDSILTDTKRK